jgi:predicted GH43/DUF377 family glycosyl hydrolase
VTQSDPRFYPAIGQQTRWRCSAFDFGRQQTTNFAYFNPGLVERPDGLWLVARRSKNDRRMRVGFNDMVAVRLSEGDYRPLFMLPIVTKHVFDKEHFEDPRAIYHNGATYLSACNFVIVNNGMGWSGAHQTMNIVRTMTSTNRWTVDERIDPLFGYNGPRIGKDTGMEKNWTWFFESGLPHLVYKASPHTVARFTSDFTLDREFKTDEPMVWLYGIIRGGTPPVRVGDEYLTFFHSSLPVGMPYHRRYYMGAYTFEAREPFAVKRMTREPLLVGSWQDRWFPKKPLVVFPCGSRLKNDTWLVTMGVNDLDCAWIEIPHADLDERLYPVNPKPTVFQAALDKLNPWHKSKADVQLA